MGRLLGRLVFRGGEVGLVLLLALFPLHAEEPEVITLGEVVVTAPTVPRTSVCEVTAEDMEMKNAQDVSEALDFLPGVKVTVGAKNKPEIMLRGFKQDKVLVLLDGIPITRPYYGDIDLSHLPVGGIAGIRVMKGGTSPIYGPNAMGGSINIVTKTPGLKPTVNWESTFSYYNTQSYTLNLGRRWGDSSLWLSTVHQRSKGFRLSGDFKPQANEDGGRRENSDYEKNSVLLKISFRPGEGHRAAFTLLSADNEKGIPPHVSSPRPEYWRLTDWRMWSLSLADEFEMAPNLSLRGWLFYNKYDDVLKSYDDATYSTQEKRWAWTSTYDESVLGLGLLLNSRPSERRSFKVGLHFQRDVHKEQDDVGEPWEKYVSQTFSLGVEQSSQIEENLSLSLGLSYDVFDKRKAYKGPAGRDVSALNYRIYALYSPSPEVSIYASIFRRTRFPTLHQLYSSRSGNPDLKEQENRGCEFGLQRSLRKVKASLCYFYNDVRNLIQRAGKGEPFMNTPRALFKGLEADIFSRPSENLTARLSYTFLEARDKRPELLGRKGSELPYVPKHKIDLEFRFKAPSGLCGSLLGSYTGKTYYYDRQGTQHQLPGYWVWDLGLIKRVGRRWEASIYITNLLDENYQEEEGYPQPGRTLWFRMRREF